LRLERPVQVAIFEGRRRIALVSAQWYRQDLEVQGKNNGEHGFVAFIPALLDGKRHELHFFIAGTSIELKGSPRTLSCEPENSG
jgi:hypothetical protein